MSWENILTPPLWYGLLQIGVLGAFGITAIRAWRHSRARFIELMSAFLFGLLLEQGDIFLFGTYRYDPNWVLLGDVPVAIALTWAMIIAGAMNITDAFGIGERRVTGQGRFQQLLANLPAPMADATWAILLDLALDAVAIRLGLWTWTIRADQGWFGVPWGNFFAWLFVALWFSFLTRWVRAHGGGAWQWAVPLGAFAGLIATLVPFVALENTAALPFVPDTPPGADDYNNGVWIIFVLSLGVFVGVTAYELARSKRQARETPDHWLLFVRLTVHVLFLVALIAAGIYWTAPLLLGVTVTLLVVELALTFPWLRAAWRETRGRRIHSRLGAQAK